MRWVSLVPLAAADFGQPIVAYYSGISLDTVKAGGVNALSLAFFSPMAMSDPSCDFTDPDTPCVKPASGAGGQLGFKWAINVMTTAADDLAANSGAGASKGAVLFSFGGLTEGGAAWDEIFSTPTAASQFGKNAASLVAAATAAANGVVTVGIDLDVEGTSSELPHFGDFIAAFRKDASYEEVPLMLCSLSGLADPASVDNYKVGLLQQHGPTNKGVTWLNMMVNNVASSCTDMSKFWRDERLHFLPSSNLVFGMWGLNNVAWILKDPGCTDGSDPLFPWMKKNGAGFGIWQWWSGDPSPIKAVVDEVKQSAVLSIV
mmetsp:Transcript_27891/g.72179  ORF Transcript_27891/g.72179 Transcript_27891/m.72179 type:complete len:317 (+) Transcript_27891:53-1003(+)